MKTIKEINRCSDGVFNSMVKLLKTKINKLQTNDQH